MAIDMEQELKRTTALRGFRFGLHDFVAKLKGADALKKHNDAIEAGYLKKGLLDNKTKELAKLAERNMRLTCTIQDRHVWLANDHGSVEITSETLKEPAESGR